VFTREQKGIIFFLKKNSERAREVLAAEEKSANAGEARDAGSYSLSTLQQPNAVLRYAQVSKETSTSQQWKV
jgi:hypothetical protein